MSRVAKRLSLLLLALLLGMPAAVWAQPDEDPPEITRGELKDLVKRFANDKMKGRESGEPECDQAADMIAAEFERCGLKPMGGPDDSWFQPFTSPRGVKILPTTSLAAKDAKGKETTFKILKDFVTHDQSGKGRVDAKVAFVGYGISDKQLDYDDYAGIDVKGRVCVALRHAPRWKDKRKSPFAKQGVVQRVAAWKVKVDNAAAHGAVALIMINDPASTSRSDDELGRPGGTGKGKIPVLHMTWSAGKRLGSRIGVPLSRRQRAIDAKFTPRSELVDDATIQVHADLVPDERKMKNVIGLLEPEGAVTTGGADGAAVRGTVVVGAHYDHVGLGHFGSLGGKGNIHNGADDNASGTTAMLEIAELLSSRRAELKRRILFIAFCGEELGLLGSKHYVREPRIPHADCHAMLNLDMVGRLEKNRLFVGGTGTSPIWPEMMQRLNKQVGKFDLTSWPGGKAPSDHASFYEANLPVLFFFTGLHGDYHRPSDDPKTLNFAGQEKVARFAAAVAMELATRDGKPQFTRCDAGGFTPGPYTGLAVEQKEDGVYVAHVDKRSPATKARFKVGDKIIEWGGAALPNTNSYNDRVSKAKAGDKVDVVVERDGKRKNLKLKLGKT